ncbi:MAG: extracellular solute-binding protein [Lachnospiraceae bacterium]|nr:extracellular solute-binding protein [Lachnospiraceae bacterium]
MNRRVIVRIAALVILVGLIAGLVIAASAGSDDYSDRYAGADLQTDIDLTAGEDGYSAYLRRYADAARPQLAVKASPAAVSYTPGYSVTEYEGRWCIMTEEVSAPSWTVDVPEAGLYRISFEYCPVISRGIDAERRLLINGEVPFRGADSQTFTRFWTDDPADAGRHDNQGNQIRAKQIEVVRWDRKTACDDGSGYVTEPYMFYFDRGRSVIALEGVNEPLAIGDVTLEPVRPVLTYEEYLAEHSGAAAAADFALKIQGEDAALRSDPSLYPRWDHSYPNTDPYDITHSTLNMIGGSAWTVNGQWIEWEAQVPEDGLYHITLKAAQGYNRGQNSQRRLLIDGEVPFAEAEKISFQYDSGWQTETLGDGRGAYDFYLTAGTHSIRLQVTLGDIASPIGRMEESVARLNQLYRRFLVIMGRNPDRYRDYDIEGPYPRIRETMRLESMRLYSIADEVTAITGGKSSITGTITVTADLLEGFAKDPSMIKRRLSTFRDDITALGTAMMNMTQSQLDLDYLVITSKDTAPESDEAGFFKSAGHEIRSFFSSFTTDYDSLGDVYEDADGIEVWILTGRDQANTLKTIIDDSFTPSSGIAVNLKLVESGSVLPAVAAGNGPDVVLSSGQGDPVNYALRNAAEDLMQFEGCEEVLGRFAESAVVPFRYAGGVYGLPETQGFNVLYYRKDILEELGIKVPETWDELENILPILQNNNLQIGMPDIMSKSAADLSGFFSMMYQNGCMLYDDDGTRAMLDAEGSVKAFERYTAFYTDYDLAKDYSFVDRFRSGEMPIGITNFGIQNTLSVFAPELKGLWAFTLIPGTRQADGSIDRSVMSYLGSCMILRSDDTARKAQSWEFLKWWTSADIQARFGQEMECLMGAAARYATANLEAFQQLSWSREQLNILNEQRSWTVSNQEVPGGYYTGRHIVNAVRKVVNENAAARETLLDYNKTINDEIKKKRIEFGLEAE